MALGSHFVGDGQSHLGKVAGDPERRGVSDAVHVHADFSPETPSSRPRGGSAPHGGAPCVAVYHAHALEHSHTHYTAHLGFKGREHN